MKKIKVLKKICGTSLVILLILASPFIIWKAKPSKILNVIIIDKTVPDATYREHKGFMWILNNLKIKNGDLNTTFSYDKNYYGFFPLPNEKYITKELPEDIGKPNLIYLTDTYGVYNDDFYKNNSIGNKAPMIYGGTKGPEVDKIKNALNKNTIIGEFNTLASPTDSKARESLQSIFGLRWNKWIGRYFSELSKDNIELPYWMQENYAMQYGEKWNFSGAGIVLVNSNDTIIVLRLDVELAKGLNKINFTPNAQNEFHIKNNVNYYYWFEICKADKDAEILAKYTLDVTKEGQKILDKYDLPTEFPAIVRKTGNYTSYYFAGDFADSNSTPKVYSAVGMELINKITTFDEDANQNYFYWNVYYPLIKNISKNIN
ncbi:MAG: hypothetical protein ACI8WT_002924 [Clostridium sp.]|jgi:hypothetical protein